MKHVQTDTYKTKDLALTGALIIHKQKLVGTQKEGQVYWFIFENKTRCDKLADQYFFGKLMVNVREYQQVMHQLKNIIFTR